MNIKKINIFKNIIEKKSRRSSKYFYPLLENALSAKDLISGMESMLSRLDEKDKNMVTKTIIYNLETCIRNVFESEIRKENCLPITRHNKKFIKFLKTYS